MFRVKHIYFLFLFFTCTFAVPAQADTAAKYCSQVKNSNDLVKCLNKYYDKAKAAMLQTFQQKLDSVDKENGNKLRDAQKAWITYRDSQCEWEADNEKTESLKRITQLYCLVRITDARNHVLSVALENIQEQQKFHGVTPRWENVLAEDFKDVFWRKNAQIQSDINCNGRQENTIVGVRLMADKTPQYVIGFVEGSSTGRPNAALFELPVGEKIVDSEDSISCGNAIQIEFTPQNPTEVCQPSQIDIKNGNCVGQSIRWANDQFEIDTTLQPEKSEAMQ